MASQLTWLGEPEKNPAAQVDVVSCGKSMIDDVGEGLSSSAWMKFGPVARP